MSNLFRGLKPKATISRNGFDLSQKHVFTSRPGQLIPCLCLETVPRDHIEINMANLTRTVTLNTAAFIRGKFNFDFFFVPYSQLWHPFNQFIDQRRDQHTMTQKGFQYCPTINLKQLLDILRFSTEEQQRQESDDIFGYPFICNAARLLDMLGYGAYYYILSIPNAADYNAAVAPLANKYVNLFRLAAYQHIWYDVYRNKYFDVDEEYAVGVTQYNNYVSFFNFDDLDCRTLNGSRLTDTDRIYGLCQMRYVQYKKDLLTSVMPSTQFGAVSSISLNVTPDCFDADTGLTSASGAVSIDDGALVDSDTGVIEMRMPSVFDVLQLRKAELLQRWKQNTLRAGNMVDDNYRAHFGVTPRYESDNQVLYLGSHSANLQVNPVTNNTESYDSATGDGWKTGDLGATGTAVAQGDRIIFDLKDQGDYGIIMCVCYYTPENEYNAQMLDKANTLYEQFDFYTPEFENIGLEAVSRSQYDFSDNPANANNVLGYAPRYWMYKTALDKVHGEFMDSAGSGMGSLKYWVAPRHEIFANTGEGALKLGTRSLSTFYVDPAQLNNVFGVQIRPDNEDLNNQDADPFMHNVFFDIKAIRPMSVLGLPQF